MDTSTETVTGTAKRYGHDGYDAASYGYGYSLTLLAQMALPKGVKGDAEHLRYNSHEGLLLPYLADIDSKKFLFRIILEVFTKVFREQVMFSNSFFGNQHGDDPIESSHLYESLCLIADPSGLCRIFRTDEDKEFTFFQIAAKFVAKDTGIKV